MRVTTLALLAAGLLAGCALIKPGTGDAVKQAALAGQDAADITCTAVKVKAPAEVQAQVIDGLKRADAVLQSDDIGSAALLEAMGTIQDEQWRAVAQAGLRVLLRRIAGGEIPATIAKDSPLAVGATSFVVGCSGVLGDSV